MECHRLAVDAESAIYTQELFGLDSNVAIHFAAAIGQQNEFPNCGELGIRLALRELLHRR
jgi:hypothetical protein